MVFDFPFFFFWTHPCVRRFHRPALHWWPSLLLEQTCFSIFFFVFFFQWHCLWAAKSFFRLDGWLHARPNIHQNISFEWCDSRILNKKNNYKNKLWLELMEGVQATKKFSTLTKKYHFCLCFVLSMCFIQFEPNQVKFSVEFLKILKKQGK